MSDTLLMPDANTRLVINPITRTIAPKYRRQKAVYVAKGDHNSVLIAFEMPRYVDGHDMSAEENNIQIHYANISEEDNTKHSKGFSGAVNVQVEIDEATQEEIVSFCWLVPGTATKYAGTVSIGITFERYDMIDGAMREIYSWNTAPYGKTIVWDSMDNTAEAVEREYSYLITICNALVTAMLKEAIDSELDKFEELFSVYTQEAVDNWLDEHPEATTTVQNKSLGIEKFIIGTLGYVTPEMFGAKGDGVTDDTEAITKAMAYGGLVVFPGLTYLVNAEYTSSGSGTGTAGVAFHVPSNTTLYLGKTTINIIPNALNRYYVFDVKDAENVTIYGGIINGDRETHLGTEGEWGYGIRFANSKNCNVINTTVKNMWGDGITVTSASENVIIDGCDISLCRRQGITLGDCACITIRNCHIHSISGKDPQSGIDIEPDKGYVKNIYICDNVFTDCLECGVYVSKRSDLADVTIENVTIKNNTFIGTMNRAIASYMGKNISIVGNVIKNLIGSKGIYIQVSDNVDIIKNSIVGSVFSDSAMYLYRANYTTVYENEILNSTFNYGIWNQKSQEVSLCNNKMRDCHTASSDISGYAFYVRGESEEIPCDYCTIHGNTIDKMNGFDGVAMVSKYARYCKIVNNLATNFITTPTYTVNIVNDNCLNNVVVSNFFPTSTKGIKYPSAIVAELKISDNYIDFVKQ